MRIQNSSHVPTRDLELMLGFVEGLLPAAAACRLLVEAKGSDGVKIVGQAEDGESGPFPYLVTLWVPEGGRRQFPTREQYIPYLPTVLLLSQEEELMLVLAHELRHVYQYVNWGQYGALTGPELERDAETFGYEALFAWRQRRPDRRCRTRAA